jgi:geranylgeranyl pyrophosphate synthase
MGAVAAEARDEDLARMDAFGRALGLAFQVKDDLLDCESSPADLGKKTQKDAGRGKLTYPALLGVAASRERLVELHREADDALAPLGPAADPLRTLMRFVVERKR